MHIANDISIMLLCNNEMALPAMQQLYMTGSMKLVLVPEKNAALFSMLKQVLAGTGIKLVSVAKKNLEAVIRKEAVDNKITAAWLMTFPYLIPKSLLNLIPGGFINFHYGLLPQYRGANPVLAQMINGETHNGITVHIIDENIDTGPIVMQQKIPIEDRDTFGRQLQKLGVLGASMAMQLLQICRLTPVPPSRQQDSTNARYFKKPVAEDLMIKWQQMKGTEVIRLINACNPWNKGAATTINNMVIKLAEAELAIDINAEKAVPGTIISLDEQQGLQIYCFDNAVIKVNVISTQEGLYPGKRLLEYGVKKNDRCLS